MKWRMKRRTVLSLLLLAVAALLLPYGRCEAGPKTYYHFTLKAFLDPHNLNAVEWAWVTLVEVPKTEAYPQEAALIESYGGSLRGSVLAFVRGSAWRSEHSYTLDKRCKDRPAEMKISWHESWSDRVYAQGGLENPNNLNELHFGFTTRPILRSNKRWYDPKSRAYVVAGPVRMGGAAAEEMRGEYTLRPVNYRDALKHYSFCGKDWVKQYRSKFNHFHLHEEFLDGYDDIFNQTTGRKHVVYQVIRSSSRTHPNWKAQRMDLP